MIVKLLTERNLEILSLTGGCRGPAESTLVKKSNCWKSHVAAQLQFSFKFQVYCIFSQVYNSKQQEMHVQHVKYFSILQLDC